MTKTHRPPASYAGRWVLLAAATALALPADATTWVRLEPLPGLIEESRRAVLATVTAVHHDFDERRLHATFVTLRVEEVLYGENVPPAGDTLDIKIYGSPEPLSDGSRLFVEGTPRYTIGDRFLLLLCADSPWGFTSAAGLMQGAFRITEDAAGRLMAWSLGGNHHALGPEGLGRWLDERDVPAEERPYLAETHRPVPYSLLRRAILQLRSGLGRGGGRP
jgi:hypothetical protein